MSQFPHLSHPKYRPDIDGLRAVAVLAVVAFHAFPNSLKGGFVGVDIFFVISGYLISTIIFDNLERGTFRFSEFYARRVRRIFPALIFVLLSCLFLGWFLLLADEYKQLGKHIAGGAVFSSNFVLWKEAGYFDSSAETKPLLHLWSLGIEEQFYIVWPLLLWLAWRRRLNLFTITFFVAIISFALSIKAVKQDVVGAFYSPQTRFWELLSGSLLAWIALHKTRYFGGFGARVDRVCSLVLYDRRSDSGAGALANLLSFFGSFLLLYGFWRINQEMSFPGKWALVPVIGAFLLISAGPQAWINRAFLSNKLVVWFGLISFPLYLWHWPLLSLARIVQSEVPSLEIRVATVVVSILLAWFTYRFVERPLRGGARGGLKVTLFISTMVAIGCAGFYIYANDGLKFRKHAVLQGYEGDIGHLDYHRYIAEKFFPCTPSNVADDAPKWEGFVRCMQSKSGTNVDVALLGDSHSEHLFLGMAEALPSKNVAFYIKGTVPYLDNPDFKNIFQFLLDSKSVKTVVVSLYWNERYSQIPVGSSMERELIKLVDVLSRAGKNVYLTDDVPAFPFSPEVCKGRRWLQTRQSTCTISIDEFRAQSSVSLETLNNVIKMRPAVRLLRIGDYMCDGSVCGMTLGSKILYRDSNHLNLNGSAYIGRSLVEHNPDFF